MGKVLPSVYITAIIIFVLVLVGGVSILTMFSSEDPTYGDSDKLEQFNRTFNVMDDVVNEVDTIESNIVDADTDFGLFGVLNALISSAWQGIKLFFSGLGFMSSVWTGLSSFFGVPPWIPVLIGSLGTIMIAFAILGAIFKWDL